MGLSWDPIKKEEWHNVAVLNKKTQMKEDDGKVIEVAVQRNILGFRFAKSQEWNATIDIEKALKFTFSPEPLALAHADYDGKKDALYDHALSKVDFEGLSQSCVRSGGLFPSFYSSFPMPKSQGRC